MTFCVYPRFLLSPEDALFCAHFVKLLHKIKVPGFLTVELIDIIVNAITGSLYCVTEDEAGNCAIFFNEIWKCANSWRYDNDAFASDLKDTVRTKNKDLGLDCAALFLIIVCFAPFPARRPTIQRVCRGTRNRGPLAD